MKFSTFHLEGTHQHVTDNAILTHENDSWYGVSRYPPTKIPPSNKTEQKTANPAVAASLSMPANGQPSEYKVSVAGSQNPDGYVTSSQVEAKYPVGQLPSYPPQTAYYQNNAAQGTSQAGNKTYQAVKSVEYLVPPPQQVYDGTTSGSQQQPKKQQQQQQQVLKPQSLSQQPAPAASQQPKDNDILDVELEKRPSQQPPPPPLVPQPKPAPQKVPSAKNYPIDLVLLKEQPLLGSKADKAENSHQLLSVKLTKPVQTESVQEVPQQKPQSVPAQLPSNQPAQVSSAPSSAAQQQQQVNTQQQPSQGYQQSKFQYSLL